MKGRLCIFHLITRLLQLLFTEKRMYFVKLNANFQRSHAWLHWFGMHGATSTTGSTFVIVLVRFPLQISYWLPIEHRKTHLKFLLAAFRYNSNRPNRAKTALSSDRNRQQDWAISLWWTFPVHCPVMRKPSVQPFRIHMHQPRSLCSPSRTLSLLSRKHLHFLDAISFTGENFTKLNLNVFSKMYGTYFHDWSRFQVTAYRKFKRILGILRLQGL